MMRRTQKRAGAHHDEDFMRLEGQVKRCKISLTPGELRLEKDILLIEKHLPIRDFQFERTVESSRVVVVFSTKEGKCGLSRFLIVVPKYYPHEMPAVTCLDGGVYSSAVLPPNGPVLHTDIVDHWNATKSLSDVIAVLQQLRSCESERGSSMDDNQMSVG